MKKIILVFILIVVAVLAVLFFFLKDRGTLPFFGNQAAEDPFTGTNLPDSPGQNQNATNTSVDYNPPVEQGYLPRLVKIFEGPTSGFTLKTVERTEVIDDEKVMKQDHLVYFIDRRTGYGYTYNIDTKQTDQVSNKTVPGIIEAKFSKDGSNFVGVQVSKNDTVMTFTSPFMNKEGFTQLDPVFLDNNLLQAEINPKGDQIAISTNKNSKYELVVVGISNLKGSSIFESPITEWDATWINNNEILLQTKPASFSNGASYVVNAKTGAKKRLVAGQTGLKALVSPTRSDLYVYSTGGSSISLFLHGATTTRPLSESTLVDKCAWENSGTSIVCARPLLNQSGNFPESWYQGNMFFKDMIVRINALNGQTTRIDVPLNSAPNTNIDATNLMVSKDGTKTFFIDKNDLSLWMLRMIPEAAQ